MTLCIGALAQEPSPLAPCLVLCFDYKIANDEWGSESEYKLHRLNDHLVALFAGAPGRAKELALIYQEYLKGTPLTLATAGKKLRKPWSELKRRMASAYVGRTLGLSYRDFLNHGANWFGPRDFYDRVEKIEKHRLRVELIIGGFIEGQPALFLAAPDRDRDFEPCTNFAVIGTGAYTAEPALHARSHLATTPLSRALYNVYEAKRIGETSPFVGTKTRIIVLRLLPKNGGQQPVEDVEVRVVTDTGEKWLRRLFGRYGPRPIRKSLCAPQGALEVGHTLSNPTSSSRLQT
jgi:hypothetical protein